ncbi:MAG: DUF342 domain-containing protein, partial [Chitinivibrionales bacterium]|nr:DUF342 domain-containing protein [Chitinivibrionales bacterium]
MLVTIEEISPGMVLMEDVVLPNGAVLVNASAELTDKLIDILKKRGIEEVQAMTREEMEAADEDTEEPEYEEEEPEEEEETGGNEESHPTSPTIRILVSDDHMSANLIIEPAGGSNEILEYNKIMETFEQNGIEYGINEKKISSLVEDWQAEQKPYEIEDIARGAAPTPGKEGELEFKVKHIENSYHCSEIKNAERYWQIVHMGGEFDRVDKGTVIAERQMGIPPVPGKNIKGELVSINEIIKEKIDTDDNVEYANDGNDIVSKITGIAYFSESCVGVIPINFDGAAVLATDPEMMIGRVTVHPPGPGGKVPSPDYIKQLLEKEKICFGIKEKALKSLADSIAKGEFPEESVVVAEGK